MAQDSKNIYKTSREVAGITQERAAELMNMSVRCLAAYERGERLPPANVVMMMVEYYNAQYLAYQHLKTSAEVGQAYMPDIELKNLPEAILRLQKEFNDFMKCRDDMVEITCDGQITDEERPRWDEILKELNDIANAIMSVKFAKEGS